MPAHPHCVRLCVACAIGPPRANRAGATRIRCAHNNADALFLTVLPPRLSYAITPRRRGVAMRQHGKRVNAGQ